MLRKGAGSGQLGSCRQSGSTGRPAVLAFCPRCLHHTPPRCHMQPSLSYPVKNQCNSNHDGP